MKTLQSLTEYCERELAAIQDRLRAVREEIHSRLAHDESSFCGSDAPLVSRGNQQHLDGILSFDSQRVIALLRDNTLRWQTHLESLRME